RIGEPDPVVEQQQVEVPKGQDRRRNVQQSDGALVPQQRPRKEQEEVQRQRRKENRGDLLDELQRLVAPVDVAGRRVDVDDERQQGDEVEDPALGLAAFEEREQ